MAMAFGGLFVLSPHQLFCIIAVNINDKVLGPLVPLFYDGYEIYVDRCETNGTSLPEAITHLNL